MKSVVRVGSLKIGANNPVVVKGMIKSSFDDRAGLIKEAKALEKEGCQILRIAIEKKQDAQIIDILKSRINIPVEADIHFDYRLAILSLEKGVDCLRLNPLNINKLKQIRQVVALAKDKDIPIRVGVNSGGFKGKRSEDLLVSSMAKEIFSYIKIMENLKFKKIMVSAKAPSARVTLKVNQLLYKKLDYPIHLGLTATGPFYEGLIKSSITLGILLYQGIGSALRVSLNSSSLEEVKAAKVILQSLGLGFFYPEIISCPTCSRCKVDLRAKVEKFKKILNSNSNNSYNKKVKIALMGCPVNGPGEASSADIGIAFGKNYGVLFKEGRPIKRIGHKLYSKVLLDSLK
ncbi:MAG: (E)-4-hydroxy-3-methylbut-2-enyl-diphosphate synthase [Candidatus Omnitrophica bacterium]|nr:(E)-4-hydroxy-3-methylbut-2-enyl-diphosphate synthase [Candidatus Omnitrophota bacterium]